MIANTTNRTLLAVSGTEYDFDFRIDDESELKVYGIDSDGDSTLLTTGFSISFDADNEEGTVTFDSEPSSYEEILMLRSKAYTQNTDIPIRAGFSEEDIENALDHIVMLIQQLKEITDYCVKFDLTSETTNVTLPTPEAGKPLVGNSTGTGFENADFDLSSLEDDVSAVAAAVIAAAASADAASTSADAASASAAAAAASASSVNLPSLSGQAGKVLQVKSDETGYELTAGNAASRPVILDASSRLPAVDGSQLTGLGWVDRGDPSSVDFSSFTNDGTWRDLDLSSIVPAGAKAAMLRLVGQATTNDKLFSVRKNGNSNSLNVGGIWLVAANVNHVADVIVTLDSNRIVEYAGTSATWSNQTITVKGWFI